MAKALGLVQEGGGVCGDGQLGSTAAAGVPAVDTQICTTTVSPGPFLRATARRRAAQHARRATAVLESNDTACRRPGGAWGEVEGRNAQSGSKKSHTVFAWEIMAAHAQHAAFESDRYTCLRVAQQFASAHARFRNLLAPTLPR